MNEDRVDMTGNSDRPAYETRDARFKNLLITGAGLYGLIILGLLMSWGVYRLSNALLSHPAAAATTISNVPNSAPGPLLQTDPHAEYLAMRAAEDSILTGYGWYNKDSGLARIPIDRAMALLVQKGLPVRSGGDKNTKGNDR